MSTREKIFGQSFQLNNSWYYPNPQKQKRTETPRIEGTIRGTHNPIFDGADRISSPQKSRRLHPQEVPRALEQADHSPHTKNRLSNHPSRVVFPVIKNPTLHQGKEDIPTYINPTFENSRYDQLLAMNKGTLLNYLNHEEVPKLVEAMGGAENFVRHFGYSETEYFDLMGHPPE